MKSKGEWRNHQIVSRYRKSICDTYGDIKSRRKSSSEGRHEGRERKGVEKGVKKQEMLRFCGKRSANKEARVNMWYM